MFKDGVSISPKSYSFPLPVIMPCLVATYAAYHKGLLLFLTNITFCVHDTVVSPLFQGAKDLGSNYSRPSP